MNDMDGWYKRKKEKKKVLSIEQRKVIVCDEYHWKAVVNT